MPLTQQDLPSSFVTQVSQHVPHDNNQAATASLQTPQVYLQSAVTNTLREGDLPSRPRAGFSPNSAKFHANNHSTQSAPENEIRSYVNFMARRELIADKIEKFDDNPVNYHTWKASFNNMIRNVGITPSEEFSLLVEYTTQVTGPTTTKCIHRDTTRGDHSALEETRRTVWMQFSSF